MGKAEMNGEMVNDAFDMAEDPNLQTDAEDVYSGILGEIGLEYSVGQPAVASKKLAGPAQEENKEEEDDLEKRLAALRS